MTKLQARRISFWLLLTPLLLLYIGLAVPFFGILTFDYLTHDALSGCERTTEGLIGACYVNGIDAGWVSGAYITSFLLTVGLANVLIAFVAIPVIVHPIILFIWLVLAFWLYPEQSKAKSENSHAAAQPTLEEIMAQQRSRSKRGA